MMARGTAIDPRRLRLRMVRELAARGITDGRVLDAMSRVPRHLFVPEGLRSRAYEDCPLPIGYGQTISQPSTVALMSQMLETSPGMRVLEVGTGSGYQAAVLAGGQYLRGYIWDSFFAGVQFSFSGYFCACGRGISRSTTACSSRRTRRIR